MGKRSVHAIRGQNGTMKHHEITQDIIGAAIAVLNELKPGLDEKLYENALLLNFKEATLTWKRVVRGNKE